ncbi:cyanase [Granulicella arctica]|uniref:Cyanate hydratase n=1 Tax=Granulicella arctica TaxID=940613 RepID=A0A7Y9PIR2_9BACT|nr:cyanase [Granulicella arctica]NYF80659.1 cyanate lyase [Granulicella arctica]
MLSREVVSAKVLSEKVARGLTWKGIAAELGSGSDLLYTAALLGQSVLTVEEAAKAAEILGLTEEEARWLTLSPERGAAAIMPPTDPLIYRFYELIQNYGTTWKALIEEEFGDGIMSAIDFNMSIEREADPKGDRVKIAMSGKFLPFKRF